MDNHGIAKTLSQIQQLVCHLIASFVHLICLTSYTYKVIDCKCRGMNCLAVEVSQTFLENNCLIIWHRKSVPTKTLQQILLWVCHVMANFVHMYTILFVSLAFIFSGSSFLFSAVQWLSLKSISHPEWKDTWVSDIVYCFFFVWMCKKKTADNLFFCLILFNMYLYAARALVDKLSHS